jgi:uncharacterized protein involved in copper resistance
MLKILNAVALAIALPAVANAQRTAPATQPQGQIATCPMHSKMAAMDHSKMSAMDMKMDHSTMSGMDMSKMDHSKMMVSCHMPADAGSDSAHHGHDAH